MLFSWPNKIALVVFTLLSVAITPVVYASEGLFGSIEFKAKSLKALPKWTKLLGRIQLEEATYIACEKDPLECQTVGMHSWRSFVKRMKEESFSHNELVQEINLFVNQWPYITDSENWKKRDYWATPSEFTEHSGDCEDYAIIKYVTLKELGVSPENMRIVVVHDHVRAIDHAVLAVYDDEGLPMILDSLIDAVLSHRALLQYTPHYSVNETTRWAHINPVK